MAFLLVAVAGGLYFNSTIEEPEPTIPELCDLAMVRSIAVDSCRSDAACILTVADYENHISITNFGREYCSNERNTSQKSKETLRAGQE
jgi:hypothetical protein